MKRQKGYFSISAVAHMFNIHQQTIRMYEKQGLITPQRSAGNTRLFTEEDINQLEEVIYLTHHVGVNLAGVEMILKLKKQMQKLQEEINKKFEETNKNLDREVEQRKSAISSQAQAISELRKSRALQAQDEDEAQVEKQK